MDVVGQTGSIVMIVMVMAIAGVLALVLFSGRMPPRVRRVIEGLLSVAYPLAVGVLFAILAWTSYEAGETVKLAGFAAGGVFMVLLAARAWYRGSWRR